SSWNDWSSTLSTRSRSTRRRCTGSRPYVARFCGRCTYAPSITDRKVSTTCARSVGPNCPSLTASGALDAAVRSGVSTCARKTCRASCWSTCRPSAIELVQPIQNPVEASILDARVPGGVVGERAQWWYVDLLARRWWAGGNRGSTGHIQLEHERVRVRAGGRAHCLTQGIRAE